MRIDCASTIIEIIRLEKLVAKKHGIHDVFFKDHWIPAFRYGLFPHK
jgi:hypothetical protein